MTLSPWERPGTGNGISKVRGYGKSEVEKLHDQNSCNLSQQANKFPLALPRRLKNIMVTRCANMFVHNIKHSVSVLMMLFVVLMSGCVYHDVSACKMIADINAIRHDKNAALNILWYHGSDNKFDYFAYVYNMGGTKLYKIPLGQLSINHLLIHTKDSSKWIAVSKIDGEWSASRLHDGVWREDRTGQEIHYYASECGKTVRCGE